MHAVEAAKSDDKGEKCGVMGLAGAAFAATAAAFGRDCAFLKVAAAFSCSIIKYLIEAKVPPKSVSRQSVGAIPFKKGATPPARNM